jgi:LuxR family maltose regulon positive regulatory protein
LTEIREVDLRFTLDEAAAFLNNVSGLALSDQDIHNLETRTEGWIAGLHLAALILQDRPDKHDVIAAFTGSHRHVIEYLVQEVLSRQSEEVRTFLFCTSVVKQFNASLSDALTNETNGKEVLNYLERANLFLNPLDDQRNWYRYHHLFAEFLRQRLRQTQPEIIPELFMRASQWYEAHGIVDEAIEHALAGKDVIRAARLLDENAETLFLINAEVTKLISWADRLPLKVRAQFPRLCIFHAFALQFEYQLEAAESILTLAEAHLAEPTKLPESFSASQVTGYAKTIRAYTAIHWGEFDQGVALSRKALESLPEEDTVEVRRLRGIIMLGLGMGYFELGRMESAQRAIQTALPLNQQVGGHYAALACIQYLMLVEIARGMLKQARATGEKGLFWIEEWSSSKGRKRRLARSLAHLRFEMSMLHYEGNNLIQAAEHLNKSCEYYELVGSWYQVRNYLHLVDLHHALGDIEKALFYLQEVKRIILKPGFSIPTMPLEARITMRSLLLSQSQPHLKDLFANAVQWAQTCGLKPDDEFRYVQEYEYLTLAYVLTAGNKAEKAVPLLDRLISSADGAGRNGQLITYLSLQAVAHHNLGDTDKSLKTLSRALELGEPQGYLRTFVDLGRPMKEMLQIAARQDIAFNYVSRLLVAFPDYEAISTPSPASQPRRLGINEFVEPLNDREMRILRYMAGRLSNQEIANELYLSVNTVKWYARNIYSKLGVGNRRAAVIRARGLGIL